MNIKERINTLKQQRDSADKELRELRNQFRNDKKKGKLKEILKDLYKERKKTSLKEEQFDYSNITDPDVKKFIEGRIKGFDILQTKLNQLIPLIKKAKRETIAKYSSEPNKEIIYGTDIAVDYLEDLITLFSDKTNNIK